MNGYRQKQNTHKQNKREHGEKEEKIEVKIWNKKEQTIKNHSK